MTTFLLVHFYFHEKQRANGDTAAKKLHIWTESGFVLLFCRNQDTNFIPNIKLNNKKCIVSQADWARGELLCNRWPGAVAPSARPLSPVVIIDETVA